MIKLLKNNNSNAICLLSTNTSVTCEATVTNLKNTAQDYKNKEIANCSRFADTAGYKYYYMIKRTSIH